MAGGVDVLLGAHDELGHAVVDVVRDAPALLFLGDDDLLHQRRERALARRLVPPGPEREGGRRQDERHLKRVHDEREREGNGALLQQQHLEDFPGGQRRERAGQDQLAVVAQGSSAHA